MFPGAFCWHVKGLFGQGVLAPSGPLLSLGLGLMQLTWFFSSLYLCSLYFTLFFGPRRGPRRELNTRGVYTSYWGQEVQRREPAALLADVAPKFLRILLLLGGVSLVWSFGLAGLLYFETL